jgi:hypothetical protein
MRVVGHFARRNTEKSIKAIEEVFIVVGNRRKPSCFLVINIVFLNICHIAAPIPAFHFNLLLC